MKHPTRLYHRLLLLGLAAGLLLAAGHPALAQQPVRIVFLHHSCGQNLIDQGGVREGLTALGHAFYDHGYNGEGLRLADGSYANTSFDVPDENTDPDGLAAIFAQPLHDPPDNTFSYLMQYDAIAFKSCFPVSNVADEAQLAAYQAHYLSIRDRVDQYPGKLFIIVTQPPQVPDSSNRAESARARAFTQWLQSDAYLAGHPNLVVFDFFGHLAGGDDFLRPEYRVDDYDAHPNERANQAIGPLFVQFVDRAVRAHYGDSPPPPVTTEGEPETPAEPPAAPPAVDTQSTSIDDFEPGSAAWWADGDGMGSTIGCSPDGEAAHGGSTALRVTYDLVAGGWGTCGRSLEPPLDGSGSDGLSLWLRAERAGQWVTLELYSGDPSAATPFEAGFETPPQSIDGWVPVVLPWSSFTRAAWADEGGLSEPDPARITGYALSLGAGDGGSRGVLWVDDVALSGDAAAAQAQPVAEAGEAGDEALPAGETEGRPAGRICPFSAAVLPLGAVAVLFVRQRKLPARLLLVLLAVALVLPQPMCAAMVSDDPNPPAAPVKLIFIHHSCGENWLADDDGSLGLALRDNNYFVSDTNYGWGPDSIGDQTDVGHWWLWFRGPDSSTYRDALYTEYGQHASYSRLSTDPGGENEIVMFKSCYPNSHLGGSPTDPPVVGDNPLRGESAWSEHHTVANAKGIYNDLLAYFATRQDRLFVVVTAPPLASGETDPTHAANARAFNDWLVDDWLDSYPYPNVAVFDFYNILTSNGGSANTNDLGADTGNHHRWWNGAVQHLQTVSSNTAAYPGGSGGGSHPTAAGNQKASAEFVQLLNVYYHRWQSVTPPPAPALTIDSPNGGENWPAGSQQSIRWTTSGSVPNVRLSYSGDGFATSHSIVASLGNSGLYTWTTPLTPSTSLRVRVASVLSPTAVYDDSDADFALFSADTLTHSVYLPLALRGYLVQPPPTVSVRPLPDTSEGIHVFNDQLVPWMSEAQFEFAATHYAGTQKMTRTDADHLRSYNPGFVVLHYRLGLGLGYRAIEGACSPTGGWLQIVEGNTWVQEWPGDTQVHESWFYPWPAGSSTRVLNCDWGWYLVDPDDAAWRTYWSGELLRQLRANDDDGLFVDSVSVPNYLGADRYSPALPQVDAAFESQWAARIEGLIAYLQTGELAPYHLIPNAGAWVTSRDPTDYSGADGVMIESFGSWGYGSYFDLGDWQLQMDRVLSLVEGDRAILAQQYVDAADVDERMFLLGNYLLVKGRYTYLNLELDLEPEWFPEYGIPIGRPLGGTPANVAALWNATWGVYTRTYSSGLVLVNPTDTARSVDLGRSYRRAVPSGGGLVPADGDVSAWTVNYTPVTNLTLAPYSAAVLLEPVAVSVPGLHRGRAVHPR